MDIVIEETTSKVKKRFGAAGFICIILLVIAFKFGISGTNFNANRESLIIATIERGDLKVLVQGPGNLITSEERWISVNFPAHIEKFLVKPGARVKKGDILMELSNFALEEKLVEEKWELEAFEAENNAKKKTLESEIIDQEATVAHAKLDYESVVLELEAQEKLIKKGFNAVSVIEHTRSKIRNKQTLEKLKIEKRRLGIKRETVDVQFQAFDARLNKMKWTLQKIQKQVDNFIVRANMDSIVQLMPLELGQQVSVGTKLVKLARHDRLMAVLKISEINIKDIAVGQEVRINIRSDEIIGKVERIDPAIVNGVIKVYIGLPKKLPGSARPDISVNGVIEVDNIIDTIFVKRPAFAQGFSEISIYKLQQEGNLAVRTRVKFGRSSSTHIQVLDGLEIGDEIIVSNPSAFQKHNKIRIE